MKINKLSIALACLIAMGLSASSVSALTITLSDLNLHGTNVSNGEPDLSGTWVLTADTDWTTFVSPATSLAGWDIDSAQVAIVISNDAGSDKVEFSLDGVLFLTDTSPPLDWSQTWTSDVVLGSGTLFGSISADGMLNYLVQRTDGTFKVDSAELTVIATKQETSTVPDGGLTLSLLGGAIVGLGALRRKLTA